MRWRTKKDKADKAQAERPARQDMAEVGIVPLTMGPIMATQLQEAGFDAVALEWFNVASSVCNDARIMVPRDQVAEARELLDELSNPA